MFIKPHMAPFQGRRVLYGLVRASNRLIFTAGAQRAYQAGVNIRWREMGFADYLLGVLVPQRTIHDMFC